MNVEHPAVPALHEFGSKQPHEAGQTNQVDAVLVQRRLQSRLEGRAILAEGLAFDGGGRDAARPCFFETAGIGAVGDHQSDLGREIFFPGGLDQCGHVRSAPGNQDCDTRSEEHTSELQSQSNLVCRLLLEKKKKKKLLNVVNYKKKNKNYNI